MGLEKRFSVDGRRPARRGVTRRAFVQAGYSGLLGFGLADLIAARARASPARAEAKSVLIIFLAGGPSHLDTFDMKPDAPDGIRGEFRPIDTKTPGVRICEHLPALAARTHLLAIVRSMTTSGELGAHHHATQAILTGVDHLPPGVVDRPSGRDWPHFAAGLDHCLPRPDGLPGGVILPMAAGDSTLGTYSGQAGGLLGAAHDPWVLDLGPNASPEKGIDGLAIPPGLSLGRLDARRGLLEGFERQRAELGRLAEESRFSAHQQRAFQVLTSGRLAEAVRIDREPEAVHERYGRHLFGRALLTSRRLIQAGVGLVQANLAEYFVQWDTHSNNHKLLKEKLLPPMDRAVAALLDDMEASGLLDETLVLLTGEFGRTPRMGGFVGTSSFAPTGRDHWMGCFSAAFAGGGVRGGRVIGASDKIGAYPATRGYPPSDVGATIYAALGLDPASEVRDIQGRPLRLNEGSPIAALYE